MFAVERQKRILDLLEENGAVWVSKLAEELDVTEETIRRDLEKLENSESLVRTHGGAVPISENNQELSLEKRKKLNIEAKALLAKEAVKHIHSGDTVFLDASTTIYYIAKEIKNLKNITVVTNSLRIVTELSGNKDIKVICIGGMAGANQSIVGSMAENNIRNNYFANKVFFSSRAVNQSGILDSNEQEGFIKVNMMKNSEKIYYVCDKSKFGKIGFVKLADFDEIDYIITEKGAFDSKMAEQLKDRDVKIIEA
jgi:DeoR/GlpR family transcriptional regulator of sugar metabolism